MTWTDRAGAPPTAATATTATRSARKRSPSAPSARASTTTASCAACSDPADPASAPIVEYTWGKIWNAKAYNACSNMPRFGHAQAPDRAADPGPDGAAARSEVAGQPVALRVSLARRELPAGAGRRVGGAGMALDAGRWARRRRRPRPSALYEHAALRQRQPSCTSPTATRSCCRSTFASRASTSASARHARPAAAPGRRAAAEGVRHRAAARARAHAFTYLDFEQAARRYGKVGGFAHLATLVKRLRRSAPRRAAARRRRHLAGLGHRAVDAGPGHGRRRQAARRRRHDRPLGVHLRHGARARRSSRRTSRASIEFLAQNVKTTDFGDPVFKPYVMREINGVPVRDHRPGVPVHADRQPALLRAPTGPSASRTRACRRRSTRRARKGAQVVVLLSHNGMDVDLKLAVARAAASTRSSAATPTTACRRRCVVSNARRQDARHQRRLATASSSACSTSTCSGGKVADFRYRLLPVFANLLPADREMEALIDKVRAPYEAKLAEKLAVTEGLLYRRGNFNGSWRPADPRRADGGEGRRDRVLARLPLGHRRCCPAGRSRASD